MKNRELAQIIANIADLLAIQSADSRRVLAYRRAAENLETLAQEASELWRAGKLQQIPGVGAAIAAKIDELLSSGELATVHPLRRSTTTRSSPDWAIM